MDSVQGISGIEMNVEGVDQFLTEARGDPQLFSTIIDSRDGDSGPRHERSPPRRPLARLENSS
jgi:hypothetical protein